MKHKAIHRSQIKKGCLILALSVKCFICSISVYTILTILKNSVGIDFIRDVKSGGYSIYTIMCVLIMGIFFMSIVLQIYWIILNFRYFYSYKSDFDLISLNQGKTVTYLNRKVSKNHSLKSLLYNALMLTMSVITLIITPLLLLFILNKGGASMINNSIPNIFVDTTLVFNILFPISLIKYYFLKINR